MRREVNARCAPVACPVVNLLAELPGHHGALLLPHLPSVHSVRSVAVTTRRLGRRPFVGRVGPGRVVVVGSLRPALRALGRLRRPCRVRVLSGPVGRCGVTGWGLKLARHTWRSHFVGPPGTTTELAADGRSAYRLGQARPSIRCEARCRRARSMSLGWQGQVRGVRQKSPDRRRLRSGYVEHGNNARPWIR